MPKSMALIKQQNEHKLVQKPKPAKQSAVGSLAAVSGHLGNAAVQRLLAQRSGDGAFDLDNETADRINRSRGGGQPLDTAVQTQMGQSMGTDFSGVRVHTGSESHELNQQLGAKAFTTGRDVFFREGEYSPSSSGGQELIAHELTHVAQQSSGAVGAGGGAMRVNAPGDRFEQEADSVAKTVTNTTPAPAVQRQTPEEEEPVQAKRLQRQEMPEEEVQTKLAQRQEEEEVQTKALQRQEEEEEIQKAEMPEEEEAVQKAAMPEEEAVPA